MVFICMYLFHINFSDINSIAIISNNFESAHIFVEIYLSHNKSTHLDYRIGVPVSPAHLTRQETKRLMRAIAQDRSGYAVYDDRNGWKIIEVSEMPFELQISGIICQKTRQKDIGSNFSVDRIL